MKRVWNYAVTMWQPVTLCIVGAAIIVGLFAYKINTLVPGASKPEAQVVTAAYEPVTLLRIQLTLRTNLPRIWLARYIILWPPSVL